MHYTIHVLKTKYIPVHTHTHTADYRDIEARYMADKIAKPTFESIAKKRKLDREEAEKKKRYG